MKVLNILLLITKNLLLLGLVIIAGARIFFPKKFEEAIIIPNRQMPVFGRVLGVSWDTAGDITDLITNKTVNLAEEIETNDLNLKDKIDEISSSENPKDEVNKILEDSINKKVEDLKDLPAEKLEELKEQIRQEMYKQVCGEWLKESSKSID